MGDDRKRRDNLLAVFPGLQEETVRTWLVEHNIEDQIGTAARVRPVGMRARRMSVRHHRRAMIEPDKMGVGAHDRFETAERRSFLVAHRHPKTRGLAGFDVSICLQTKPQCASVDKKSVLLDKGRRRVVADGKRGGGESGRS